MDKSSIEKKNDNGAPSSQSNNHSRIISIDTQQTYIVPDLPKNQVCSPQFTNKSVKPASRATSTIEPPAKGPLKSDDQSVPEPEDIMAATSKTIPTKFDQEHHPVMAPF